VTEKAKESKMLATARGQHSTVHTDFRESDTGEIRRILLPGSLRIGSGRMGEAS
jgi:hypothetical protein